MTGRSFPATLMAVAAALVLIVASPAGAATTWTVQSTPNPGGQNVSDIYFTAVSGSSPTDIWAAGVDQIGSTRSPLIAHWDGTRWRAGHVPVPANSQSWFNGMVALSSANAWAVGESTDPNDQNLNQRTLIEHWDGVSWTIVPSPNPFTQANSADVLMGIDGVASNDIWTTGWAHDDPNDQILMLFEHWNGRAWTVATSPSPPGSIHFGSAITTIAANDAWAVGNVGLEKTLAAHWNGKTWSIVPTPSLQDGTSVLNSLTGVTANAGNDVWASGYEGNVNNQNFQKPYMLHWNGTAWTLVLTPNLGGEGSRLNATVALSPTDVWAVGQTQELDGRIFTLTEQFDGTTWAAVPSPSPSPSGFPIDSLHGVTSPGPGVVVTVGTRSPTTGCCLRTLALSTTSG